MSKWRLKRKSKTMPGSPDENPPVSASASTSARAQFKELLNTLLWAMVFALILRTFLFQPFHIPSGSMLPGLMRGDYIITSKFTLGYGRHAATPLPFPRKKGRLFERMPERGDVIVFRPEGSQKNFIKRLIGLPGDQIQMIEGVLHINNQAVELDYNSESFFERDFSRRIDVKEWTETFSNGHQHKIYDSLNQTPNDNTTVRTVPAGHYFMMGDNRDFSSDSRVSVRNGGAGFVPAENLMGIAEIILLSADDDFVIFKPWTWANLRGSRFFKKIE